MLKYLSRKKPANHYLLYSNCLSYRGKIVIFVCFLSLIGTEFALNVYKSTFFHFKGYHFFITQSLYLIWGERLLITGFGIKIWIQLGIKALVFPELLKWVLEFSHNAGNQGSSRIKLLHHEPWWRATMIKPVCLFSLRQHCYSKGG